MSSSYHVPVLAEEVVKYLITDKTGVYVDGTLGGGGHSKEILGKLAQSAKLIGIDQDEDAINTAKTQLSGFKQVEFVKGNFSELATILDKLNINNIHGMLLDLGVSSFQIDSVEKGFSYQVDTALDMRMDKQANLTAADVLNRYTQEDLIRIFFDYGEERHSRSIAKLIVSKRKTQSFKSTFQLTDIIARAVHPKHKIKSYSRIFQALRIEVNQELENLKIALADALAVLKKGGRLVVISYHSLEDRIVKQFFKYWENPCMCPIELPQCVCGKTQQIKIITKKPIKAAASEVKKNSRARSALLRVGEKYA